MKSRADIDRTVGRIVSTRREPREHTSLHHRYAHDVSHVLGLGLFGAEASHGELSWNRRRCLVAAVVLVSPLGLALLWARVSPPPAGQQAEHYFWLGYLLAMSVICTLFSYGGVRAFHHLTPALDEMLTDTGRAEYDDWADTATSNGLQIGFALAFATAATGTLLVASRVPGISQSLYIGPASFYSVFLSGLILSGGAYWLIQGTVLALRLTGPNTVVLSAYAPMSTPGMELLARCFRLAFYGSCVGVSVSLVPILSWAYRVDESLPLTVVKFGLFVACVATTTAVAVIPQWRLSALIAERRRQVIHEITHLLPADPAELKDPTERESYLIGWLQTVTASPSTTVSASAIQAVLLAVAATALPFGWQILLAAN